MRTNRLPQPESRLERLARFRREHPYQWYDGRELATIAGAYAWRSHVSDLRRSPYGYDIQNRQRSVKQPDGTSYTVSEYRFTSPGWRGEMVLTGALTPASDHD